MNQPDMIRVWDPLVRIFHWLLVVSFSIAWYTQEANYELHLQAGYTIIGLVCFRIFWGLIGPTHARFTDFVTGPRRVLGYTKSLLRQQASRHLGHNPAGGMMVLLLLLGLTVVTISGIALDGAENWSGPLAEMELYRHKQMILDIHVWSTNALLILIPLHILGVIHASIAHRENLIKAMISGNKRSS